MVSRQWTRDDDKRFETLLAQFPENYPNRFETIAEILQIPLEEVIYHYEALVYDIDLIESGQVAIPDYPETSGTISFPSKHVVKETKKLIHWSEEEHRLFLEGLEKFGKGDWKSISKECVRTRSRRQVASHAQRFFVRQSMDNKSKKRSGIHDRTLVNAGGSSAAAAAGSNASDPIFGSSTSTSSSSSIFGSSSSTPSSSPIFGFSSSTTPQQSVSGNSATAPPPNGFNNNQHMSIEDTDQANKASSNGKIFKPKRKK